MLILLGIALAGLGMYFLLKGKAMDRPVGLGILGLGFALLQGGSEPMITVMIGIGLIVAAVIWGAIYADNEKNGTNARRRLAEQQEIEVEYQQAVASQASSTPWQIRYATEPCPNCRHYKVRNAKWEDKQLSVAFWGIASSKIGKDFKCEHCGEMW